ncbi:1473_t:CDS:1, partial [Acaulospora colombiana]
VLAGTQRSPVGKTETNIKYIPLLATSHAHSNSSGLLQSRVSEVSTVREGGIARGRTGQRKEL